MSESENPAIPSISSDPPNEEPEGSEPLPASSPSTQDTTADEPEHYSIPQTLEDWIHSDGENDEHMSILDSYDMHTLRNCMKYVCREWLPVEAERNRALVKEFHHLEDTDLHWDTVHDEETLSRYIGFTDEQAEVWGEKQLKVMIGGAVFAVREMRKRNLRMEAERPQTPARKSGRKRTQRDRGAGDSATGLGDSSSDAAEDAPSEFVPSP